MIYRVFADYVQNLLKGFIVYIFNKVCKFSLLFIPGRYSFCIEKQYVFLNKKKRFNIEVDICLYWSGYMNIYT